MVQTGGQESKHPPFDAVRMACSKECLHILQEDISREASQPASKRAPEEGAEDLQPVVGALPLAAVQLIWQLDACGVNVGQRGVQVEQSGAKVELRGVKVGPSGGKVEQR